MIVYAAQEMDVEGVAEEVVAVAVPRTDPPPANPASDLPRIKRGRNQIPYIYNKIKQNRKPTSSSSLPISSLLQLPSSSECSYSLSLVVNTIVLLCWPGNRGSASVRFTLADSAEETEFRVSWVECLLLDLPLERWEWSLPFPFSCFCA